MKNERLLYGRLLADPEWKETILCSLSEHFARAKELAAKDGYGHFREATIDLSRPPDFAAVMRASLRRKGGER